MTRFVETDAITSYFENSNYLFFQRLVSCLKISKLNYISFFLVLVLSSCNIIKDAELEDENVSENVNLRGDCRVMFYNCENLFDIIDDPNFNDDLYIPQSAIKWNVEKYNEKINHISLLISDIGSGTLPEIVGLCEVENLTVLSDIVNSSLLLNANYQIIHYDSPDERGSDVAMLYKKDRFIPVFSKTIPVNLPSHLGLKPTRDILYVKGFMDGAILHIFVNHWLYGTTEQFPNEQARIIAATELKNATDSILNLEANADILILGDFNDKPLDKSLSEILNAYTNFSTILPEHLYNLSFFSYEKYGAWTYKNKSEYIIIDQVIVSGNLLNKENPVYTTFEDFHTYNTGYLLIDDSIYGGYKPFNTYYKKTYLGGYSDHLPLYVDIHKNNSRKYERKLSKLRKEILQSNSF